MLPRCLLHPAGYAQLPPFHLLFNDEKTPLRRWLKFAGIYALHAVIAGVAVFLVSTFLGAGVDALNYNVGNLIFWAPIFPSEIILGFFAGLKVNKFLRSRSAEWAWVLPAVFLISDLPSQVRDTGWNYTLSYLFAGKCADCVEVAILVAPLYASIAYSVGAFVALRRSVDIDPNTVREGPGAVRLLQLSLYSASVVIGVFVLAFVLVLGTRLLSHSAGALVETFFNRPHYVGEIVVALAGGVLVGTRIRPQLAKWVWVLPSLWLLGYMVYSVHLRGEASVMHHIWTQFFTNQCARPYISCPYETFGTCPFFSSLAFSLGAWLESRIQ